MSLVPYYFDAYGITFNTRQNATTVYAEQLYADFVNLLQYLRDNFNARKSGAVGFSMGGYWALVLAATKQISAGVSYYGALSGGGPGLNLRYRFEEIFARDSSPILILHGSNDSTAPVGLANNLATILAGKGSPHELVIYPGVEHSFDRGTNLDPAARDDAWNRTQALLGKHVNPLPVTMHFAQFGDGLGFTSDLVLTNPSATVTASGKVEFFDDNGLPLVVGISGSGVKSTVDISVPPLGTATISTDGKGGLALGSARVTSDNPLGGVVRFSIPGIGIAGVGESQPLSGFVTPVRRKSGGINTGVALRNTESTALTLKLTLRNRQGQAVANGTRTIENFPAGGHVAKFINELFPDAATDDFEGTLVVQATGGKVGASSLELGPSPGQFTALPVTALK
ncbi:MAG: dienelactone hydrolase family protein [Acidobacteria bacterium]|nr:dienelactone hydrolase family protein [Acidobacteriota bacterium]